MSAMVFSEDRQWLIRQIRRAKHSVKPGSVLEVGYPYGCEALLDLWECRCVTVDPEGDKATFKVRFEDLMAAGSYDVVNMTSVLDYVDDPIDALRKARSIGRHVLLQGRLNTYHSDNFKTKYWTPTKQWVSEKCAGALGIKNPEWVEFRGDQLFSVFGKVEH